MVKSLCGKFAKYILFAFNFIFWLTGGALLGAGILIMQDKFIIRHLEKLALKANEMDLQIATYVLIGTGGFIFLIGFFGCCGATHESRLLLGLYAFLVLLIVGAEAGAAFLIFFMQNKVEKFFVNKLKDELNDNYRSNSTLGRAWDMLQTQFKCCGAVGPFEWRESAWFRSEEARRNGTQMMYAPWSCCPKRAMEDKMMGDTCQEEARGNSDETEYLFVQGCYDRVLKWVQMYTKLLVGVGAGIAALQVLGFLFACFLVYEIGSEKRVGVTA